MNETKKTFDDIMKYIEGRDPKDMRLNIIKNLLRIDYDNDDVESIVDAIKQLEQLEK